MEDTQAGAVGKGPEGEVGVDWGFGGLHCCAGKHNGDFTERKRGFRVRCRATGLGEAVCDHAGQYGGGQCFKDVQKQ